jgi:NADH-quinone oxidoreductase subunit G
MDLNHLHLDVDHTIITAQPGQNVLEACLSAQLDLPYFCWHPALGAVGACRQCAVKLFNGPEDHTGTIVMACMTPVTPGMRLSITDPATAQFRDRVIEFVLTNHPHDCPVCEVGGECHLQDMTALVKHTERRYRFTKRTHLNQDLGPFIRHEMNRCIGCYRCVRFYRDYAGGDDFGVFGANRNIYFGRATPGTLESEFAGNLVEVCPTGVFVDKPFATRFRRKWDMRATPSICPHCAVGCNITVQEREGEFRRVVNRYNAALNGYFLCDRGRFGVDFIRSPARLRTSTQLHAQDTETPLDIAAATAALAEPLQTDNVIGIGSPRASLEANAALRLLVGPAHFYAGVSDHDADIIATAITILRDAAVPIATPADAAQSDTVLILGEDPSDTAPILALSLRQSAQRATSEALAIRQIPAWNDSAARRSAAGSPTPLIIATPMSTRLDDCATACHRLAPTALLTLAATIKAQLEPPSAADPTAIAAILCCASAPVIVVGGDSALLRAAANIVTTLRRHGIAARLSILLPEANSLGLGLFGAPPLSAALAVIQTGLAPHVIVLENDLHRRSETGPLEHAFSHIASLSVLDCIETPTTATADLAIAVGSFADADGTIVNQEGRAQRSFKAIFGADDPAPSWHILRNAGIAAGRLEATAWASHRDLIEAMAAHLPDLAACRTLWPHAHEGDMQRPATLPHRYSGRTAVNAASHVREPQPFANPDSPLGPTMEGPMPRTGLMPHVWSPGWNSVQANLKFPSAAEPGVMLFPASTRIPTELPLPHPPSPTPGILALPIRRVFGSDELSNLAPAVASRVGSSILRLSPADAATRGLSAGTMVDCTIGTTTVRRTIALDPTMAAGVAGITIGVQGEANPPLPGSLTITAIHSGKPS